MHFGQLCRLFPEVQPGDAAMRDITYREKRYTMFMASSYGGENNGGYRRCSSTVTVVEKEYFLRYAIKINILNDILRSATTL